MVDRVNTVVIPKPTRSEVAWNICYLIFSHTLAIIINKRLCYKLSWFFTPNCWSTQEYLIALKTHTQKLISFFSRLSSLWYWHPYLHLQLPRLSQYFIITPSHRHTMPIVNVHCNVGEMWREVIMTYSRFERDDPGCCNTHSHHQTRKRIKKIIYIPLDGSRKIPTKVRL